MKTLMIAAALFATPAFAFDPICGPEKGLLELAGTNFDAAPKVMLGMTRERDIVTLWESRDGTVWLIVSQDTSGRACIEMLGATEEGLDASR